MNKFLGPTPLYNFLKVCNSTFLEKNILDCGAAGKNPPLAMFHEQGYKTQGIDISDEQLKKAEEFCVKNNMNLNINKGDITEIPFENESISFIYSYNSVFHLTKKNTAITIKEIERVLKKEGLCFINFLSVNDCGFGEGEEINKGEFAQKEYGERVIHSYYEENEADKYFDELEIIYKEKRTITQIIDGEKYILEYIDYIVKKV